MVTTIAMALADDHPPTNVGIAIASPPPQKHTPQIWTKRPRVAIVHLLKRRSRFTGCCRLFSCGQTVMVGGRRNALRFSALRNPRSQRQALMTCTLPALPPM
jgi:hypothetical protein